ncbi:MAG: hypothetical protein KCHDKBKB_00759 [Elusimicrobia bacterium]|nr:hypothetical protein [Elusimicrobiota bacterium]
MKISIHQPAYLPYLGFIEKMKNSDVYVFLDTVQFSKNSFDNRNKIIVDGKEKWLTIPIKQDLGQTYLKTKPVDMSWLDTHLKTIAYAYRDAPNFEYYKNGLLTTYSYVRRLPAPNLADICFEMLIFWKMVFDMKTRIVRSSQFDSFPKDLHSSELLLEICKRLGATEYYSGKAGKDYLDEKIFTDAGINVSYQTYEPPHTLSALHQIMTVGEKL